MEQSAQPDESTALRTAWLIEAIRRINAKQASPQDISDQTFEDGLKIVWRLFEDGLNIVWRWFEYLEYSRNFGTMTWIYMNYIHLNHVESSSGIPSVIWHLQPCREHPGAVKLTLCHAVSKSSLHFQEHRWMKEVSRYGIQTLKK